VEYLEGMTGTDQEDRQTHKHSSFEEPPDRRFCPKCNQIFTGKTIGTSDVRVVRCVNCRGLWIQTSQLERLISWYRSATPAEQLLAEDFEEKKEQRMLSMDGNFVAGLLGLVFDENPTARFAWVTVTLILANVGIFVWFMLHPEGMDSFMLTPAKLINAPLRNSYTLITSMFLHANILHILGNMYFLFIFGDNVEERIGGGAFITFYLAAGIVANLLHVFITSRPEIPALGASGAISGVMGGYRVLYPEATIRSHFVKYGIPVAFRLPVYLYFAMWFIGLLAMSVAYEARGVAWDAHISGFIFGVACMYLMKRLEAL
jgi:membrane associated rhomboid family serine protease